MDFLSRLQRVKTNRFCITWIIRIEMIYFTFFEEYSLERSHVVFSPHQDTTWYLLGGREAKLVQ